MSDNIYETHLEQTPANYTPLSPLSFLARTADVYPHRTAVIHGDRRYNWAEVYERCRRLASALGARGIGEGDTVAVISSNLPAMYEAHFGVPMAGAVLNAINFRLDAATIAFILEHGAAKLFLVDPEFSEVARDALARIDRDIEVIDIDDPYYEAGVRLGALTYEELLDQGMSDAAWSLPRDEW
ncbi:MAG: AMP-binding protein, partial [Pseudomonadales bacterium]